MGVMSFILNILSRQYVYKYQAVVVVFRRQLDSSRAQKKTKGNSIFISSLYKSFTEVMYVSEIGFFFILITQTMI